VLFLYKVFDYVKLMLVDVIFGFFV